jgi:RNA polymerase sigma factor (sigma-70 family)
MAGEPLVYSSLMTKASRRFSRCFKQSLAIIQTLNVNMPLFSNLSARWVPTVRSASAPNTPRRSEPSDRQLVESCQNRAGHRSQAFRQLYQRHQSRVRAILYQLGPGQEDGSLDDGVQEVFVRAWKGLPKFRATAQFSTWLYRIASNVAADRRAALAKDRRQALALQQSVPAHHNDPDLLTLHYQDLVARGLAALSDDHRAVLVFHDLEALPQKEVAAILAIPIGTVKSRLFHARAALRQFLTDQGVQP